ncbi:MAG: copper homeostasis protein CutC [Muribaculaceae bacterium]|nr:copper homeostasis protein CutC [Muribaculaceae bacterium]
MTLEICAGSLESVRAAATGGAGRVELCAALGEGGVTPSVGMIRNARKVPGLKLHVLIRPRGGDFVYDESEVECMTDDIITALDCGADGIVIGALTPDGRIDMDTCRRLVNAAGNKNVNITFHRAFDLCRDPLEALEDVIALGCNRILTSGQAPTAEIGIPLLKKLNDLACGRLTILPGGGVTPDNANKILQLTGCSELHGSMRVSVDSPMEYRRPGVAMGAPGSDEYSRKETSPELVKKLIDAMNRN